MAEYIANWVNSLSLSQRVNAIDEQFSNLSLFAEILEHWNLAPQGTADTFSKNYGQNAKLENARKLRSILAKAGLTVGRENFQRILTEERGAAVRLLFKIKCAVDPQGVSIGAAHMFNSNGASQHESASRAQHIKHSIEDPKEKLVVSNNVNIKDLNLQLHLDPFFQHMRKSYENAEQEEADEVQMMEDERTRKILEGRRQRHERKALVNLEEKRGHEEWVKVQKVTIAREQKELSFELAMQQRRQFREKATHDAHVLEMRWGVDDYERNLKRLGIEMDADENTEGDPAETQSPNDSKEEDDDELNSGAHKERLRVAMESFENTLGDETRSYMDRIKSQQAIDSESKKEREQRRHTVLIEQEASQQGIQEAREKTELLERIRREASSERAMAQVAQLQRHQKIQKRQRQTEAAKRAVEERAHEYDKILVRSRERAMMDWEGNAEPRAEEIKKRRAALVAKNGLKHDRAVGVARAAVRGLVDLVLFASHFRSTVALSEAKSFSEIDSISGGSLRDPRALVDQDPNPTTLEVRMVDPARLLMPPQMWRRAMRRYVRGQPIASQAWSDQKKKQDAVDALQDYTDVHDYLHFEGVWNTQKGEENKVPINTNTIAENEAGAASNNVRKTDSRTPLQQAFNILDAVSSNKLNTRPPHSPAFDPAPFGFNIALIGPPQTNKSSLATLLAFRHGFYVISAVELLHDSLAAWQADRDKKELMQENESNIDTLDQDVDPLIIEEQALLMSVGAGASEAVNNRKHPLYEMGDSTDLAKLCTVRLKRHLASTESRRPWLLDGLPRTSQQAQCIDLALAGKFAEANKVPLEWTLEQFLQKAQKGQFKVPNHQADALAVAKAEFAAVAEQAAVAANGGKPLTKAEKKALKSQESSNGDAPSIPDIVVPSKSNFFKVFVLQDPKLCEMSDSVKGKSEISEEKDSSNVPDEVTVELGFYSNNLELIPCPPSSQADNNHLDEQQASDEADKRDEAQNLTTTPQWIALDQESAHSTWQAQEKSLSDWLSSLCCLQPLASKIPGNDNGCNDDIRTLNLQQLATLVCVDMDETETNGKETNEVKEGNESSSEEIEKVVTQTQNTQGNSFVDSLSWHHTLATHRFGCGRPLDAALLTMLAEQHQSTEVDIYEPKIETEITAIRTLRQHVTVLIDALSRASLRAIYVYPQVSNSNIEYKLLRGNGFSVPAAKPIHSMLQNVVNSALSSPEITAKQIEQQMWGVIEEHVLQVEGMFNSWQDSDTLHNNIVTDIVQRCISLIQIEEQHHLSIRETVSAVYQAVAHVISNETNPVFITVPPSPLPPANLTWPINNLPKHIQNISIFDELRDALTSSSTMAQSTRQFSLTNNKHSEDSPSAQALRMLASEFERRQVAACVQACSMTVEILNGVQDAIVDARQWLKQFAFSRDQRLRSQLERNLNNFQSTPLLRRMASVLCDASDDSIYTAAAQDSVYPSVLDSETVLDTRGGEIRFRPAQLLTLVLSIKEGGNDKIAPGDDTFLLRRRSSQPKFMTVSARQLLYALQVCEDSAAGVPDKWQYINDIGSASVLLNDMMLNKYSESHAATRPRRLSADEQSSKTDTRNVLVLGKSRSDPTCPPATSVRSLPLHRIAHTLACGLFPSLPSMAELLNMRKSFANADAKLDWRLSEPEFMSVGLWFQDSTHSTATISKSDKLGTRSSEQLCGVLNSEDAQALVGVYWAAFVAESGMLEYRHFLLGLCFDPRHSLTDPRRAVGLFKAFALCSAFEAFTKGTAAEVEAWTWHPTELQITHRNLVMLLECGGMFGKGADVMAVTVFARLQRDTKTQSISFEELVSSAAWKDKFFSGSASVAQPYVLGDAYRSLRFLNPTVQHW